MGNYVLSERAARALIPLIRGKAASSSPGYAPPPFRWTRALPRLRCDGRNPRIAATARG